MKLPRFHLSTLLLLCVFCGASIGLRLHGDAWQQDCFLSYQDRQSPYGVSPAQFTFNPEKTRLVAFRGEHVYVYDLSSRRLFWKRPNYLGGRIDKICVQINGAVIHVIENAVGMSDGVDLAFNTYGDNFKCAYPNELRPKYIESVNNTVHDGVTESQWWPDTGMYYHEDAYCWKDKEHVVIRIHTDDDAPRYPAEYYAFFVGRDSDGTRFSFDGQLLAIGHADGISVWQRARSYGWKGYLELPLFWVAFVSLIALIAIFVRSLLRHKSP